MHTQNRYFCKNFLKKFFLNEKKPPIFLKIEVNRRRIEIFTILVYNMKSREKQIGIEISYIPRDLITVIFYYQISLNPLKTQSLSQVSFPLLFPLRYIVPPVFTNSDKGKNKGKKII